MALNRRLRMDGVDVDWDDVAEVSSTTCLRMHSGHTVVLEVSWEDIQAALTTIQDLEYGVEVESDA